MNCYRRSRMPMIDSGTSCDYYGLPAIPLVDESPVYVSGRNFRCCDRSLEGAPSYYDVDNAIGSKESTLLYVVAFGMDDFRGCHLTKDGMIEHAAPAKYCLTRRSRAGSGGHCCPSSWIGRTRQRCRGCPDDYSTTDVLVGSDAVAPRRRHSTRSLRRPEDAGRHDFWIGRKYCPAANTVSDYAHHRPRR